MYFCKKQSAMTPSAVPSKAKTPSSLATIKLAKPITWEAFQRKYLTREDGFKYEWVGGFVEKTPRSMDKSQLYILRNLQQFFRQLLNESKVYGELISEPDLFFLANHRRPDVCWLTDEQIDALANPDAYEIPAFIIEVISSNDQITKVKKKMLNYRDAGVQVVWHIYPNVRQVEVHAGKHLDRITVLEGDQVCSAAPVLPAFEMTVNQILYLPGKAD